MRNIRASGRDTAFTPAGYLRAQVFLLTPVTAPVWLMGAAYFFFWKEAQPFRVLGWAFVILLTVLIALHGKDYYAAPVYPMVFAAGAIAIERLSAQKFGWIRPVMIAFVLLGAVVFLPLFAPVLSPEGFVRYQAKLPFNRQPSEKSMASEPMPHYFSWDFGWEDMVRAVAQAYQSVPPGERSDTAIFAYDFAAAGAIDLLGPKYGLPKAISGHQTYWLWGPRDYTGRTMIVVGSTLGGAQRRFNQVTVVTELHHPYAPPWENRPVLLCRGPKQFATLKDAWRSLKNWD
jgi:hypothetical protein